MIGNHSMAEIINSEFVRNESNQNSMGGTEILTMKVASLLSKDLLQDFQIVSSRIKTDLDPSKIRIFWAHDLPGDPESKFLSTQGGIDKFHKFVFVSNWQMQAYMQAYQIPWSKCIVIHNAIDPIPAVEKPDTKDGIRLIYHSTPHRGLNILTSVFNELCKKYDNIHLDVFSSFKLYGWGDRDAQYKEVFDQLESNPQVTNHSTQPNSVVREYLQKSHIFAYPSIWPETSCLCLLEAISAGAICIHSNYGALYETAANWTQMYQMNEDINAHAGTLYNILDLTIQNTDNMLTRTGSAKSYVDLFHGWDMKKREWESLLESLKSSITDRSFPKPVFKFST